jgi:hypothetical protein
MRRGEKEREGNGSHEIAGDAGDRGCGSGIGAVVKAGEMEEMEKARKDGKREG